MLCTLVVSLKELEKEIKGKLFCIILINVLYMNHSPFTKLQELQLLVITLLGIQEFLDLSTKVLTEFHSMSFPSRWQLLWSSFSSFVTRSSPPNNLFKFHILFSPLLCRLSLVLGAFMVIIFLFCCCFYYVVCCFLLGCFIFFFGFHCFLLYWFFLLLLFFFFGKEINSSQHSCLWLHYHRYLESSTWLKCLHWPKWVHLF